MASVCTRTTPLHIFLFFSKLRYLVLYPPPNNPKISVCFTHTPQGRPQMRQKSKLDLTFLFLHQDNIITRVWHRTKLSIPIPMMLL